MRNGIGPYLFHNFGKAYGRKLLDKHFEDARDQIPGLAGATFHGLRATRVIELRQRGCTSLQIQDQVGMCVLSSATTGSLTRRRTVKRPC